MSEFDLLLICLQMNWQPEQRPFLTSKLSQSQHWEQFAQLVIWHRVAPFLYDLVQQGIVSPLPTGVKAQLWAQYRLNVQHIQNMSEELVRVMSDLVKAGITAVPLKGVALAAAVYGDINRRQAGDIDLWVSQDDLADCIKRLRVLGYVEKRPFTDAQEHVWRQINYEQTWIHQTSKFVLDLHWALTPPRLHIQFEPMAQFTVQSIGNSSISLFSAEDQLLYLCLHGYKHAWNRLCWVMDVACLLEAYPNLDWTAVFMQSKYFHIQRIVRLGVLLAHQLLRVPLEAPIRAWVEDDEGAHEIMHKTCQQLKQPEYTPATQYSWAEHRYLMAGRERVRDKVYFTIRRALTLSERDLKAYPFSYHALFIYQGLRAFRFLYHFIVPPNQ